MILCNESKCRSAATAASFAPTRRFTTHIMKKPPNLLWRRYGFDNPRCKTQWFKSRNTAKTADFGCFRNTVKHSTENSWEWGEIPIGGQNPKTYMYTTSIPKLNGLVALDFKKTLLLAPGELELRVCRLGRVHWGLTPLLPSPSYLLLRLHTNNSKSTIPREVSHPVSGVRQGILVRTIRRNNALTHHTLSIKQFV